MRKTQGKQTNKQKYNLSKYYDMYTRQKSRSTKTKTEYDRKILSDIHLQKSDQHCFCSSKRVKEYSYTTSEIKEINYIRKPQKHILELAT